MSKKIVICLNSAWNLINYRTGLVKALLKLKYEVIVLAPHDKFVKEVENLGCSYVPIKIDNKGKNPLKDFLFFLSLYSLLRKIRPRIFLGFTIKPNIYGSIACNILGIKFINNITGLGMVFVDKSIITNIVRLLYSVALKRSNKIFFQNKDDQIEFIKTGIVKIEQSDILPGSGIDTKKFLYTPLPNNRIFKFLFISRLLYSKGILDYIYAARILRKEGIKANFFVLGSIDESDASYIKKNELKKYINSGEIIYLNEVKNIEPFIKSSNCIVLPSYYREGTPRVLLEALAVGRPIITTDTPGCREVLENGKNGFLCKPKDYLDLSLKMKRIIKLPKKQLKIMSQYARKKAEVSYDEKVVIKKYVTTISKINF